MVREGMSSGTGGPTGALNQPAEWTRPGEEAVGWVHGCGSRLASSQGWTGSSGSSLQAHCFLGEDGAEVIS